MNECPNIYSRPIYSNIRIYSLHSDVVPSVLFPCRHEEDPIIILVRSNYSVYIGRTSWPPVKRLLIAHHPPFISDNFLSFEQSSQLNSSENISEQIHVKTNMIKINGFFRLCFHERFPNVKTNVKICRSSPCWKIASLIGAHTILLSTPFSLKSNHSVKVI